ncbi:ArsB/NhaD family transporter [Cohnella sp. GCM10027633]|uniref:ArsB/NhaD family transporter n=1 Tax=unclassified Cohnella TaxID=2636738 RepID=UPI00362E90E4
MALPISIVVFAVTLVLIIRRPKGWNEAAYAAPAALLLLCLGTLAWSDAAYIWEVVWNATLSLIGIMVLTGVMDDNGFFKWAALQIVRRFHRRRLAMLVGLSAFAALITTFFNNDGTILIMTPIVLEATALLGMGFKARIAFLLAVGFMADTASATLMVSNLTNILTADYFGISFGDFARHMAFPGIVASAASIGMLLLLFGRTIRRDEQAGADAPAFPEPSSVIRDKRVFALSWIVLALILALYFYSEMLGWPVSLIACGAAAVLWIAAIASRSVDSARLLRRTPWLIVVFALSMYLIVYSLHLHGGTGWFSSLMLRLDEAGLAGIVFGSGALFSLLAAVINNLPAVLVSSLTISELDGGHAVLPFASLVGMSVGAKLTPIGSLATLLWLQLLRRDGVELGLIRYMKYGLLLTVPVLLATLAALWLQIRFFS